MRTVLIRMLALTAMAGCPALAQNSDVGLLLGISVPVGTVSPGNVTGSVGASGQINYAGQLYETRAGQLYLELPLVIAAQVTGSVGPNITSSIKNQIFFTPGVRWKFTLQSRVGFYAALGGGVGSFGRNDSFVGNGMVSASTARTYSGALGFGGGIDFRLTRLLSLRAEGRDFVTRAGLGGSGGRNHAFFTMGVGFHF